MPALADPGDDQPPARRGAQVDRDAKPGVEGFGELFEALDLGANDPAGDRNIAPETVRLMMDGNAAQCPIERSGNGFFPQNKLPPLMCGPGTSRAARAPMLVREDV